MKVVLLANASSVHTVRWANSLSSAGVEVILATQDEIAGDISPGVRAVRLPHKGGMGYFRNAGAFRRLLDVERPDLVNAHYASGYGTTARLSGFHPTLLSVWGSDVYRFPYRSIVHRWLIKANLRAATRVGSTSHAMAGQTLSLVPDLAPIAVTPFGVDVTRFQPRQGGGVRKQPVVIGTVKALRPVYGVDTLIRAFAAAREGLAERDPQQSRRLRLRIVGDGPELDRLSDLAVSLELTDVIQLVPHVPHEAVPSMLHQLDIYVALSRMESFGVAVIEASACGLPVIVSDVGGLPEVVAHRQTGLVVPCEDVTTAAQAIVELVLDGKLRRSMGKAGRRRAREFYDWDINVDSMISLYREVVVSYGEAGTGPTSGIGLPPTTGQAEGAGQRCPG